MAKFQLENCNGFKRLEEPHGIVRQKLINF